MGFALVAFVQPQAVGFAFALADANALQRLQQLGEVVAVGFTQSETKGMTLGIDDQRALEPFTPVFSRVPDFGVPPFLDVTTLASW